MTSHHMEKFYKCTSYRNITIWNLIKMHTIRFVLYSSHKAHWNEFIFQIFASYALNVQSCRLVFHIEALSITSIKVLATQYGESETIIDSLEEIQIPWLNQQIYLYGHICKNRKEFHQIQTYKQLIICIRSSQLICIQN